MITEDYCSYDVAKLLKDKGFYQDFLNATIPVWKLNGSREELAFYGDDNYPCEWEEWYSAPTHQMAMKWLREVHNLCIAPYAAAYRYGFTIDKADIGSNLGNEIKFYPEEEFETYENAVEAALKYCLENLI